MLHALSNYSEAIKRATAAYKHADSNETIKTQSLEDTVGQPDDGGAVSSDVISGSPDEVSEEGNSDINAGSQDVGESGGADAGSAEKEDDGDEVSS